MSCPRTRRARVGRLYPSPSEIILRCESIVVTETEVVGRSDERTDGRTTAAAESSDVARARSYYIKESENESSPP